MCCPHNLELFNTDDEALFLKNIGFRVQYFRKMTDLSQEQLAEQCGVSASTIGHIESTTAYAMSMITLYRIAQVLRISPYQLMTFD